MMQYLKSHFQSSRKIRRTCTIHVLDGRLQLLPIVRRRSDHFVVETSHNRVRRLAKHDYIHIVVVT